MITIFEIQEREYMSGEESVHKINKSKNQLKFQLKNYW